MMKTDQKSISSPVNRSILSRLFLMCLFVLICTGMASAQVNLLSNNSFESGLLGLGWGTNIVDWFSYDQYGGDLVASASAYDGNNIARINSQNNWEPLLMQSWPATAGKVYEVDGQLRSPLGANYFSPTNGFVTLVMQFLNASSQVIGQDILAPKFGPAGTVTHNWTNWSTGSALSPAGTVYGNTILIYVGAGDLTTSGFVEADALRAYETTATQVGEIENADFETIGSDNSLTNMPYWEPFGLAGAIVTNHAHTGRRSLQLYYTETLAGQTWDATAGQKYMSGGFAYNPSEGPLAGTNAHGVILLEYLDAAGTVLMSYETDYITNGSPQDTWTYLSVEGIAPSGTTTGRTMVAIIGVDEDISGSVYFDDITQSHVVVTSTQAGEIFNPGFEDGLTGNAYDLGSFLPYWDWYGGTNAGFITGDQSQEGDQCGVIVWPNNLFGQDFEATTGMEYVVEGYMMHPSSDPITSNTAFGTFLLEFFNPAGDTISVSVVESAHLTKDSATDTWIYFSVTNRAPWTGPVSGRVSCAFLDIEGTPGGASVYFDGVAVYERTNWISNSSSGALDNPGFEYSADGTKLHYIDNWEGLGFDGGVASGHARSGEHALKITYPETLLAQYWDATPGYKYSTECYISTPSGDDQLITSTNTQALLILQYMNSTGGVIMTYLSDSFTGDATPDTWSNLFVRGVAPSGTVTGRTLCALLGYDEAFDGTVWFDDVSQALVSTTPSTSGLLSNPGFDDGPTGNAYDLADVGDLPSWTWVGGTNAGFIGRDHANTEEQAAILAWPNNGFAQSWSADSGKSYVAEGYLYTPPEATFNSDGSSFAQLVLEFQTSATTSFFDSADFTAGFTAGQWHYFAVTGTAPEEANITGILSCTMYSPDPEADIDLDGVVYFDNLTVSEVLTEGDSVWSQWLIDNFGSTNAVNGGAYDDYDADGYLNWYEYMAGTEATNANSVMIVSAADGTGSEVLLTWPAAADRYYAVSISTNLTSGTFSMLASNINAVLPQTVYTATPPSSAETYFYRVTVRTNQF